MSDFQRNNSVCFAMEAWRYRLLRRLLFVPCVVVLAVGGHGATAQTVRVDSNNANTGTLENALVFGAQHRVPTGRNTVRFIPWVGIASNAAPSNNSFGLDFFTSNTPRMSITADGLLGIGTLKPTRAVEIQQQGDVEIGLRSTDPNSTLWTIQSSSGTNGGSLNGTFQIIDRTQDKARLIVDGTGMVTVGVLKITGGADVAEPFDFASRDVAKGAVVVIDALHPGKLKLSSKAYDRRVAGIVSGADGIEPGLSLTGLSKSGHNVALSGRVYALADATHAPIKPGDLLTTSNVAGHCMKATNWVKAQRAIIGKAMSGLKSGRGRVLVLVSLQ